MARIIFTQGLKNVDWDAHDIRVLLERSTSTYVPDKDDRYINDMTNFVEISVASYARQALANEAINHDAAKDQLELDADDVAFGNLESGQTVRAAVLYRHVTDDTDSELIAYDDGLITVVLAADAALNATTLWVQPLEADVPNGTSWDFGGGKTCTTNAAHSRGDRQMTVTALGAAASAGDTTSSDTDSILPAVLQNGPFNYQGHADGFVVQCQRGDFST